MNTLMNLGLGIDGDWFYELDKDDFEELNINGILSGKNP